MKQQLTAKSIRASVLPRTGSSSSLKDLAVDSGQKEESIRVCTRVRPLFQNEILNYHLKAWKIQQQHMELVVEPPSQAEIIEQKQKKKDEKGKKVIQEKTEAQKAAMQRYYAFDCCFDDNSTNSEVYEYVARDIVLDTFKGINGCCLAYGQTGSGKTHSIMGLASDPGILPRALAEFFDVIADPSLLEEGDETKSENQDFEDEDEEGNTEYLMKVSYLEIYMEKVNDLLQDGGRGPTSPLENLDVKEDPKKGFVVLGLHEEIVSSMDEVMELLQKAEQKRHFAKTNFNEASSRSHTVFTINLESNKMLSNGSSINRRGELKLVDLAGNERVGKAAEGMENVKTVIDEGKAINKSLFLLSEVISKLSKRAQMTPEERKVKGQEEGIFIPWRDSKLTRILSKSLGGNCRASVIVAVHPSHLYLETSFSTLRFAMKCKTIKKVIRVNYLSPEQSLIVQQKELIQKLQGQLKSLVEGQGIDQSLLDSMGVKPREAKVSAEELRKVEELKSELERKTQKYSKLIMKASIPTAVDTYANMQSSASRKETRGAKTGAKFGRLSTISTMHFESSLGSLDDVDFEESVDNVNKPEVFKTMDFIKSIHEAEFKEEEFATLQTMDSFEATSFLPRGDTLGSMREELEQLESLQKPVEEQDVYNLKSMSSAAAKLLSPEEGEEIPSYEVEKLEPRRRRRSHDVLLSLIKRLKEKLSQEREERRKAIKGHRLLVMQTRHLRKVLQKLGLSVLNTALDPAEKLDIESLKVSDKYTTSADLAESVFDDPSDVKPLVSAMLNYCITYSLLRTYHGMDAAKDTSSKLGAKLAPAADLKLQDFVVPENFPKSLEELVIGSSQFKVVPAKPDNQIESAIRKMEDTKQSTLDSVLKFLTPWEQHILAIIYEQHEMRKSFGQLQAHVLKRLRKLDFTIRMVSVEKLELSEHCERLHAEIWSYKHGLENMTNSESFNQFQSLMTTFEKVSLALAKTKSEYTVLSEEYAKLKEKCLQQEHIIEKLREENRGLFVLPHSLPYLDDILKTCKNKREQSLVRDVFLFQAKFGELKMKLEECRAAEQDVRTLNASLYTELVNSREEVSVLQDNLKFNTYALYKERRLAEVTAKKVKQEEAEHTKTIMELQNKLKAVSKRASQDIEVQLSPKLSPFVGHEIEKSPIPKTKTKAKPKHKGKPLPVAKGLAHMPSVSPPPPKTDAAPEKSTAAAPPRIAALTVSTKDDKESAAEPRSDLTPLQKEASKRQEMPTPTVGVPAFQGDPRDKGFASMAAAITRKPRTPKKS